MLPRTDLSAHFEGLANPTRLKVVATLASVPEIRVWELAEICKVSQPRLSWHLRILRRGNVIATRRQGREVFCRLNREAITDHLREFVQMVRHGGVTGDVVDMQQLVSEVVR